MVKNKMIKYGYVTIFCKNIWMTGQYAPNYKKNIFCMYAMYFNAKYLYEVI